MASVEIYDAITGYVSTSFSACPVAWENDNYKPAATTEVYVRGEVVGSTYLQESIGMNEQADNRWDETGFVIFWVLVRKGSGSRECHRIGGMLAKLFRGALLLDDSLEFLQASIGGGEPADVEGDWWRMPVEIEFRQMEA